MMSPVLNVVNIVVVADLVAKATVVAGFAIAAGWVARRQRAALRHLIFVAAFVVLGLLPAARVVVPSLLVRLPVASPTAGTSAVLPLTAGDLTFVADASPQSGTHGPNWPAISTSTLLQAAWMAGAIVCLLPVGLGLWQIRRVRRHALPWRDVQVMADDLACQAGGRRSIDVVLHEAVAGPMTCGVVRPLIVFPIDARTWPDADVRRALTHELEHVRRGDWATMCLARAVCAVYWFHPLVWIASRQLGLNAERACDDAVLRDSQAFGYADQLVAWRSAPGPARTARFSPWPIAASCRRG
jgi:beta-lactamase regulating signal transducer with metallopeptidase domain